MSAIRDELDRLEAMGLRVTGLDLVAHEDWVTVEGGDIRPLGRPTHAEVDVRIGSDYFAVALWWAAEGKRPIKVKHYSATMARPEVRQEALGWLWMAALADFDGTLAAVRALTPGRPLRFGGGPR